jgi:hypothetical protein
VLIIHAVSPVAGGTVRDSTTLTLVPKPTQLQKTAGDHQTAVATTRLSQLLAVKVLAGDNLPVPGVSVQWTALASGAVVDSAVTHTDSVGVARTGASLGTPTGVQSFTATVAGVGSVTFSDTAQAILAYTWTGGTSTNWSTAANWNPGAVPGATDNAIIPVTSNQPLLSGNLAVNDLTLQGAAALTLATGATLTVNGNLANPQGTVNGPGALLLAGASKTFEGTLPAVTLNGAHSLSNDATVQGALTVGGDFNIGARHLSVAGNLVAQGAGSRLDMAAGSLVSVQGNVVIDGLSTNGTLTGGELDLSGNLTVGAAFSSQSFFPTGTQVTRFLGRSSQAIQFPGSQASFLALDLQKAAGDVSLVSNVTVRGTFTDTNGVATRIAGNAGQQLLVQGAFTGSRLTFDDATLAIQAAANTGISLGNSTFQNIGPTLTQLSIQHPGNAAPFVLDGLTFSSVPSTGFYLSATDAVPGAPVLTINVTNSSPGAGAPHLQTAGGAVINWPPPTPRTWAGTISTDWNTAGNWNPSGVPASVDDVTIPSGTPFAPTLGTSTTIGNLTVQTGATLSLGNTTLGVNGNLAADGHIAASSGGAVQAAGSGKTLHGTMDMVSIQGSYTLNGTLTGNTLFITGGSLDLAATRDSLVDLAVSAGGTLTMGPSATLILSGDASFDGGDETGKLTGGLLTVGGDFTVGSSTSTTSFFPTGTHNTRFTGPGSQQVQFSGTAVQSSFLRLDVAKTGGTVTLLSDVLVRGDFNKAAGTGVTFTSDAGRRVAVNGALTLTSLTFDSVSLALQATQDNAVSLSGVTFQRMDPGVTQLTIQHPGDAAAFVLDAMTFSTTPRTGLYLSATDTVPGAPILTINVTNGSPVSGGNFVRTSGGAVVNWPPVVPKVWTGVTSTDWSTATNWNPNGVPVATDTVVIPSAPANQPTVPSNGGVAGSLNVQPGATVTVGDATLTVNGDLAADGTIASVGGGTVLVQGTNRILHGTIGLLSVEGSYKLNGTLTVANGLFISNGPTTGGSLDLAGNQATVGSLTLSNGGTLTQAGSSVMRVGGNASFDGGDETGKLTGGTLEVNGNFSGGTTTTPTAFTASGTHVTSFAGAVAQTVTMQPSWQFANLTVANGSGGSTTLGARTVATGNLLIQAQGNLIPGGHAIQVGGALTVSNLGVLSMSQTLDSVIVAGATTFGGGSSPLSGGTLVVGGDFLQDATNTSSSFAPSSLHLTVLNGASGQTVTFQTPGVEGGSGFEDLEVRGAGGVTLASTVEVNGNLTIDGASGNLNVAGQTLTVSGSLTTNPGGTLQMTDPADQVEVLSGASFGGGDETGKLTNGVLTVFGDFVQTAKQSNLSFAATGQHTTRLGDLVPRSINFGSPGSGAAGSHFANLDLSQSGGDTLSLATPIFIDGVLTSGPTTVPALVFLGNTGATNTINVTGRLAVHTLALNLVPIVLVETAATAQQFDTVTFSGFVNGQGTQITATLFGAALAPRTVTFSNIFFSGQGVGSGGLYVRLISADDQGINLNLAGSNESPLNDGNGPSNTDPLGGVTTNGATILWDGQ